MSWYVYRDHSELGLAQGRALGAAVMNPLLGWGVGRDSCLHPPWLGGGGFSDTATDSAQPSPLSPSQTAYFLTMDPKNTGRIQLDLDQVHGRDLPAPPPLAPPALCSPKLSCPTSMLRPASSLPTVAADNHVGIEGAAGARLPTTTATTHCPQGRDSAHSQLRNPC